MPTLVVGNLQAGGAGKTPMIEYLIRQYSPKRSIAVISRGYGRKTKGFVLANENTGPEIIGDEPCQLFRKYGSKVNVAVGEQRILAIPSLLAEKPETDLILLDDAFQHLPLQADAYVLLSEFDRPFFKDHPFPAGYLREGRSAAARANVLIFTKCPETLSQKEQTAYRQQALKYLTPGVWIGFTTIDYQWQLIEAEGYWLISGLANPKYFSQAARQKIKVIGESHFNDHHRYTADEVIDLVQKIKLQTRGERIAVLTTEKDFYKLQSEEFRPLWEGLSITTVESKTRFISFEMEQEFLKVIEPYIHLRN